MHTSLSLVHQLHTAHCSKHSCLTSCIHPYVSSSSYTQHTFPNIAVSLLAYIPISFLPKRHFANNALSPKKLSIKLIDDFMNNYFSEYMPHKIYCSHARSKKAMPCVKHIENILPGQYNAMCHNFNIVNG